MAAKASAGLITFAVINILIALMAPCAACVGMMATLSSPRMEIKGQDVGPQFKAHIERNVPGAKVLAILVMSSNALCALLLVIGAVGLFLAQGWGKGTTIFAAVMLILTFCIHDGFQVGLYLPAVNEFLDLNTRQMPEAERTGYKYGFLTTYFLWTCLNPLAILYLAGMVIYLAMGMGFQNQPEPARKRRDRDDDDDNDDRPRRRRRYDEED